MAHALALLGLAQLESGDLQLSPLGRRNVEGGHALRQELFGQQLLDRVPLVAHIRHSLEQQSSGQLPEQPVLRLPTGELEAQDEPV
ncbi:AAA-associated domain-containing protein [Mitsuaria sp. WAJ17]|uniref:AAA-associated domain-containing protein n=1 Tax=Mitsuaria sp. WAJ17 TaxID=2761452 RepID=UPI0028731159|nr:AAA-associated domain-containing protein [Mitsuaria sp. WAJ17]